MKRTNILILFADDQRFNTINALNNDQIYTPNIDKLVEEGTAFTQAYIPGGLHEAVCMPSRAMLLTGRHLFHLERSGEVIPKNHVLMGEHFQKNGFDTFGTGKWHNGTNSYVRSFSSGGKIFFGGMDDHWNVPYCEFSPSGKYPEPKLHPIDWGVSDPTKMNPPYPTKIMKVFEKIEEGKHSSELFADTALSFLKNRKSTKPFFMYVAFMAPHDPRTMPERFHQMYDPKDIELPKNFMEEHPFDNGEMDVRDEHLAEKPRNKMEVRRHIAEYYGIISHLDFEIGRIISALKEVGEYENTIIVFAGDNGLALGSHGLMGKQNLYDHSTHVPLIFSGPKIPKGQLNTKYTYLYDIFSTLCELVGIEIPDTVDGISFADTFSDQTMEHRRCLFFSYKNLHRAVLKDGLKLIEYQVEGKKHIQLFDLKNDPLELQDLSKNPEYQDTVIQLRKELKRLQLSFGDL